MLRKTRSNASGRGRIRGRVVVWLILVAGAAVGMSWWAIQGRQGEATPKIAPKWDRDAAKEEFEQIGTAFTDAVAEKQNIDSFLTVARRMIKKYPGLADTHRFHGQVLAVKARSEPSPEQFRRTLGQALKELEKSLELNSQQANVHEMAGSVALELELYDQAESHYSQAVGIDPHESRYRVSQAVIFLKRKKYDQVRTTLAVALKRNSALHQAHAVFSDMYAKQNRLDMAMQQIQKAIDLVPPVTERDKLLVYVGNKAELLRRANREMEALRILEEQLFPDELSKPEIVKQLALCYAKAGAFDRAAACYEQVLDKHLTDAKAMESLLKGAAEFRINAGDLDAARDHINLLGLYHPDSPVLAELRSKLKAQSADASPTP